MTEVEQRKETSPVTSGDSSGDLCFAYKMSYSNRVLSDDRYFIVYQTPVLIF